MKKYSGLFLSLFLIFSIAATALAQINTKPATAQNVNGKFEKAASNAVVMLQQKILLSDKQTSQLKTVVFNYIKIKENLNSPSKLFPQMIKMMDARQKIKFEIIRNDWWNNLVGVLSK